MGAKAEDFYESVKRRTDDKPNANELFQSSASRTRLNSGLEPSAEALGYFHSVRFADERRITFAPKPAKLATRKIAAGERREPADPE